MTPLKPPFPWFGGKTRAAHLIWPRLGDVPNYVEPFAGGLAVLLARPHEPRIETVNDLDCHLANFWRATQRDPEAVAHWCDWPVNEADLHARHRWLVTTGAERVERLKSDPDYYDPQVAGRWVWGVCLWIGGGWCKRLWEQRPDLHAEGVGIHTYAKRPVLGRGERAVYARHRVGGSGRGVHRQLPDLSQHHGRGAFGKKPHLDWDGRGVLAGDRREQLAEVFAALAERLRYVRVCCGDWSRVVGPTPTYHVGLTGVLLDPPYSHDERSRDGQRIYAVDEKGVADAVRAWAIANGENPKLRIALCGYEGEHDMPAGWSAVRWKAPGGYGSQANGQGRANAHRETIWFSRHCLYPDVRQLELAEAGW